MRFEAPGGEHYIEPNRVRVTITNLDDGKELLTLTSSRPYSCSSDDPLTVRAKAQAEILQRARDHLMWLVADGALNEEPGNDNE